MNAPRKTGDLPGQKGDIAASIKQYVEQGLVDLDVMLPAIVEKYDRKKNIVTVRPLVAIMNANRFTEKRHDLANIPAYASGAGDFVINFPIKKGNIGWIFAADRDITEYKEKLRDVAPRTSRSHSFSDGLFVPDIVRGFTISGEDEDAMVIQILDGSTKIAIHPDWIKIKAPSQVVNETKLTHSTGKSKVDEDSEVGGDVAVGGGMTVTGAGAFGSLTSGGKRVLVEGDSGGAGSGYTKAEADARFYPKVSGENMEVAVAANTAAITVLAGSVGDIDSKYGPDNKPKPGDIDKHFLYAGSIMQFSILAGSSAPVYTVNNYSSVGITQISNGYVISRKGKVKITYSLSLANNGQRQHFVTNLLRNRAGSPEFQTESLGLIYVEPGTTSMSNSFYVIDVEPGDILQIIGHANDGTNVTLWQAGYISIEEI